MGAAENLKNVLDVKPAPGLPDNFENKFTEKKDRQKIVDAAKDKFAGIEETAKTEITKKAEEEIKSWDDMPKSNESGKMAVLYLYTALKDRNPNPSPEQIRSTYTTLNIAKPKEVVFTKPEEISGAKEMIPETKKEAPGEENTKKDIPEGTKDVSGGTKEEKKGLFKRIKDKIIAKRESKNPKVAEQPIVNSVVEEPGTVLKGEDMEAGNRDKNKDKIEEMGNIRNNKKITLEGNSGTISSVDGLLQVDLDTGGKISADIKEISKDKMTLLKILDDGTQEQMTMYRHGDLVDANPSNENKAGTTKAETKDNFSDTTAFYDEGMAGK
ncbi:MAG: hypothetical protein NTY80_01090 [candidate division SR1 bacterium]|nr:hypothetical protein [candidate division SR1 bacterium]